MDKRIAVLADRIFEKVNQTSFTSDSTVVKYTIFTTIFYKYYRAKMGNINLAKGNPILDMYTYDDATSWMIIVDTMEADLEKIGKELLFVKDLSGAASFSKNIETIHAAAIIIREFDLFEQNFEEPGDLQIWVDCFDYFLNFNGNEGGPFPSETTTPSSINILISRLLTSDFPIDSGSISIYDPTVGHGSTLISFDDTLPDVNKSYYGEEINYELAALSQLNLYIHGVDDYNIVGGDILRSSEFARGNSLTQFDIVVSHPPFRLKHETGNYSDDIYNRWDDSVGRYLRSNADPAFVLHVLHSIKAGGIGAILTNQSFYSSSVKAIYNTRKYLIDHGYLSGIIKLPAGLLTGTQIPVSLLIIDKNANRSRKGIFFIDASADFEKISRYRNALSGEGISRIVRSWKQQSEKKSYSRLVTTEDVVANNYNLNAALYFSDILTPDDSSDKLKLRDVLTFIRPNRDEVNGSSYSFVSGSDLNNNIRLKVDKLKSQTYKRGYTILDKDSLLISTIGGTFRFSYFVYENQAISCSPAIMAFEVDEEKVLLNYLAKQFTEDYFQQQVSAYATGITGRINLNTILDLFIKVLPLNDQKRMDNAILNFFHKADKNLDLVEEYNVKAFEENAFLRHSIAGPLSNVFKFYTNLIEIIEKNPFVTAQEIWHTKLKSYSSFDFAKMNEIIKRDLTMIKDSLLKQDAVTKIQDAPLEPIDIDMFFTQYVELNKADQAGVEISYESFVPYLNDDIIKEDYVMVKANLDLLRIMIDNFIDNAVKHAFDGVDDKRVVIELTYDEENGEFGFGISNSGHPFPENFSLEDFVAKERKAGKNSGSGYGGWLINAIITKFGGTLAMEDNSIFKPELHQGLLTTFIVTLPLDR